jgi:CspA family cold shock protein
VRWFSDWQGYGFITPDAGGRDLFVHGAQVLDRAQRGLREGDRVEFEIRPGLTAGEAFGVVVVSPSGRLSTGDDRREEAGIAATAGIRQVAGEGWRCLEGEENQ